MLYVDITGIAGATKKVTNPMLGEQVIVTFENGYGASIVENFSTHGTELAVLDNDGGLTYETPVTDDVIGGLDAPTLRAALEAIAALPARGGDDTLTEAYHIEDLSSGKVQYTLELRQAEGGLFTVYEVGIEPTPTLVDGFVNSGEANRSALERCRAMRLRYEAWTNSSCIIIKETVTRQSV